MNIDFFVKKQPKIKQFQGLLFFQLINKIKLINTPL